MIGRTVNTKRAAARSEAARKASETRRERIRRGLPSLRSIKRETAAGQPGTRQDYTALDVDTLTELLYREQSEQVDTLIAGQLVRHALARIGAIEAELFRRGFTSAELTAIRFAVADSTDAAEDFATTLAERLSIQFEPESITGAALHFSPEDFAA